MKSKEPAILNRSSTEPAHRRIGRLLSRRAHTPARRQNPNPEPRLAGVRSIRRRRHHNHTTRRERLDGTGVQVKSP
jgi:hypothetical protein